MEEIMKEGQSGILAHENRLETLLEALSYKQIKVYGPSDLSTNRCHIYKYRDKDSSEVANLLDERYNIAVAADSIVRRLLLKPLVPSVREPCVSVMDSLIGWMK